MPYKRKSFKRKTYKRRRYPRKSSGAWGRWVRKQPGTASLWDTATSAASHLIKMYVNTEHKYLDATFSTANLGTVGIAQCISNVPLGDGPSQREGRQVKLTGINLKPRFTLTAAQDTCRLIVVQARTENTPNINSVLTSSSVLAFRNLNLVRDYKVLYDKTYSFDADNMGLTQLNLNFKIMSKLQYNVTDTAGQANPVWGAIWVFALGTENTNETSFVCSSRIRYIDN